MFKEYLKGNSIIHKIDPRLKIIYALALSSIIAVQKEFIPVVIGFLTGMVLVFLARIKVKEIMRRLLVMDEFLVLLWLILPFSYPGEPILKIWRLQLTSEGFFFYNSVDHQGTWDNVNSYQSFGDNQHL